MHRRGDLHVGGLKRGAGRGESILSFEVRAGLVARTTLQELYRIFTQGGSNGRTIA